MMTILDKEEQELSDSVERGEWKSVPNLEEELKNSKKYAAATVEQNQRMEIQIPEKDLNTLKIKAAEGGMSYQMLVADIIHKYLYGELSEKIEELK